MSLPLDSIIQGDCLEVMRGFPADSIDCVITSTPYWGLRSYSGTEKIWGGNPQCQHLWAKITTPTHKQGGEGIQSSNRGTIRGDNIETDVCSVCGAWKGQLGLEPHPKMFIEHLVEVFREVRRILKPSGTFWLNLGDTFFGSGGGNHESQSSIDTRKERGVHTVAFTQGIPHTNWLQPKQKLMIPARTAIAFQDDGWILRNEIVWAKPNPMPESVKDRLTETWESVFLFVKNRRYYFDLDSIRKPYSMATITRNEFALRKNETYGVNTNQRREDEGWSPQNLQEREGRKSINQSINPKGGNPGDVWSITTHSFSGAHFATFPEKLVEPMIKAGCPNDGVILDPFCGSGTTCLVAKRFRRHYIGIDLNQEYVEMARNRINESFDKDQKTLEELIS